MADREKLKYFKKNCIKLAQAGSLNKMKEIFDRELWPCCAEIAPYDADMVKRELTALLRRIEKQAEQSMRETEHCKINTLRGNAAALVRLYVLSRSYIRSNLPLRIGFEHMFSHCSSKEGQTDALPLTWFTEAYCEAIVHYPILTQDKYIALDLPETVTEQNKPVSMLHTEGNIRYGCHIITLISNIEPSAAAMYLWETFGRCLLGRFSADDLRNLLERPRRGNDYETLLAEGAWFVAETIATSDFAGTAKFRSTDPVFLHGFLVELTELCRHPEK